MREYVIHRIESDVPLCGDPATGPWASAKTLSIDRFPWTPEGSTNETIVRMIYDDSNLYMQYLAEDNHISASASELNGPVSNDDCVEFFADPNPGENGRYFNFEANCIGTILVGVGSNRDNRRRISPSLAEYIPVATPFSGPRKEESPEDSHWWLAAVIPFGVLSEFTGADVTPERGSSWRANVYRCGGMTNEQFAVWNPVDSPYPDFHRPSEFGRVIFD